MAINPRIKQKAEDIRKKIFGTEVRESLASGIEAISEDVEATIGRQDYVEEQFQDVLDETTGKDVINGPEIIAARNGEPNLKTRLDKEKQEVTAQLRHTVKKGEISIIDIDKNKGLIDETYLSDSLKEQMAGTTEIGSTPPDRSITPTKTTFFKTGKNLFNKATAEINRSVSSTNGTLVALESYATSDFIPITPGLMYTRSHTHTLAFYNSDKLYLSGIPSVPSVHTFTVPVNAVYMRTSVHINEINNLQVELGPIITTYEPYTSIIPKEFIETKLFSIDDINDKSIPPDKTTFFETGKNLFDKSKVRINQSIVPTTGNVITLAETSTSDYIPVVSNETYTRSHAHTLAFYDNEYRFISGISSNPIVYTFTTPSNATYIRTSFATVDIDRLQVEKGAEKTNYEPYKNSINEMFLPNSVVESKFVASFSTVKQPADISENTNPNLSLIATKCVQRDDTHPDAIGYLYLNTPTQKIYYSKGKFDKPDYLFTWDLTLSNGVSCENYQATITKDGDVIFLRNWLRENPIIYPSNNYDTPFVVDFGSSLKPYCWLNSTGVEQHPEDDYFIFGEYTPHSIEAETNNDPRNIWKVSKPYGEKNNWKVVQSFKHVFHASPISDRPDVEIGHVHTVIRDFYTNTWYASTGDIDRHCRVWQSIDNGEEWSEVAVGGQKWRALGMVFTEDGVYWGTDAHNSGHGLYRAVRDTNTGLLDFTTLEKMANLDLSGIDGTQPTYATCLLREPHGLLFLDRAEARPDNLLDLVFWSFKYEKLFRCGTFKRVKNANELEGRHGFGNQVSTTYQPTSEDGIITGGGEVVRPMTIDILNHRTDNFVGNVKITITEV